MAEFDFDPVANTSTLIREYVWFDGKPVAVIEGGVVYYVRSDHIGKPVFATDATGTKVWEATYLPFGGVHTSSGANITLRFPGQWFQSESGLHQNWMRDYDPTTGRYIQADPLGLEAGISLYGYAFQNPGKYIDPTGENPVALCFTNPAGQRVCGAVATGIAKICVAGVKLAIRTITGSSSSAVTSSSSSTSSESCSDCGGGEDPCKRQRENLAQAKLNNPGSCLPGDSLATVQYKYSRIRELLKARMEAFQCIADNDPEHKRQINDVRKMFRGCAQRLGR